MNLSGIFLRGLIFVAKNVMISLILAQILKSPNSYNTFLSNLAKQIWKKKTQDNSLKYTMSLTGISTIYICWCYLENGYKKKPNSNHAAAMCVIVTMFGMRAGVEDGRGSGSLMVGRRL